MSRFLSYTNSLGREYVFTNILTLKGFESPSINQVSTSSSGQDGETYVDTFLTPRELEISFDVFATDAAPMYQIRREIIGKLSPKYGVGSLRYVYGDKDVRMACTVSGVEITDHNTKISSVLVRFKAFYPYFVDSEQTVNALKFAQGMLIFPTTFPCIFGVQTNTGSLTNIGDAPAPVVIRFYGRTTNPMFKNKTTGEVISIVGTISEGEILEIDTEFGVKSITLIGEDGTRTNAFSMLSPDSVLWSLPVGSSEIEYAAEEDTSDSYGELTYYNRYVGI